MKLALIRAIVVATVMAGGGAVGVLLAQAPEPKPLMAEEVFTNLKVLRGIPVDEFMETMGFFSAATGLNCTDCHVGESGGNWAKYADDTRRKVTARRMMAMVTDLNRTNFDGRRVVTCWSCHRGSYRPDVVPDLAVQYSTALPRDPFEILKSDPDAPSVDAVLGKYIQAVGGAQRVAALKSVVAKGTYGGYDTLSQKVPIDIFANAPDQRTTIVHTLDGDSTTVYDGRAGWVAAPETMKPVPILALTGANLDDQKIEATLMFPSRIKDLLTDWRVGQTTSIGDTDVQMVQGKLTRGGLPVTLYFDAKSGFLVRVLLYTTSPLGLNPRQIDFADYRDVTGIKMPFKWVVTWTDGKSTTEVSEVRPNVAIDASRFAKPPASKPPTR
jgi:photosynthetic reaction center cytochrome c subunit